MLTTKDASTNDQESVKDDDGSSVHSLRKGGSFFNDADEESLGSKLDDVAADSDALVADGAPVRSTRRRASTLNIRQSVLDRKEQEKQEAMIRKKAAFREQQREMGFSVASSTTSGPAEDFAALFENGFARNRNGFIVLNTIFDPVDDPRRMELHLPEVIDSVQHELRRHHPYIKVKSLRPYHSSSIPPPLFFKKKK